MSGYQGYQTGYGQAQPQYQNSYYAYVLYHRENTRKTLMSSASDLNSRRIAHILKAGRNSLNTVTPSRSLNPHTRYGMPLSPTTKYWSSY